jgi:hypothetical protein
MPYIEHVAVPHDLHAIAFAAEIGVADELEAACLQGPGEGSHARIVARFDDADAWL